MCFVKKLAPEEIDQRFGEYINVESLEGDMERPSLSGNNLYSMVKT